MITFLQREKRDDKKFCLSGAAILLLATSLSVNAAPSGDKTKNLEIAASVIVIGNDPTNRFKSAKDEYLKKLSAGGKACFLLNRRDYQEALDALERCPNKDSGSGEYVRAMCLEGLDKHKESVAAFERAKAKIGSGFHPSAVFYLQFATPYFRLGDYENCLKYLELARKNEVKPLIPGPGGQSPFSIAVSRRSLVAQEKKGQAKEAFDKYVAIFGKVQGQLHLNEPITASPEVVAKAKAWLAKNKAPAETHPVDQAKFYLTTGKAQIAVGDLNAAKAALAKASDMTIPDLVVKDRRFGTMWLDAENITGSSKKNGPVPPSGMAVSHNALVQLKDQASVLLVRLYLKEKNYAEACKYLRRTFAVDPADSFLSYFNVIHFKEVPDLVTSDDLGVHSAEVEERLEQAPLLVLGVHSDKKSVLKAVIPMLKHPLLDKARQQVEQLQYAECLKSLDQYLAIYRNAKPATTKTQMEAEVYFEYAQVFRVSLLKISAAFASNRRDVALSVGRDLQGKRASEVMWESVSNKLEGKNLPLSDYDSAMQKKYPTLIDWGYYASGVRLMKFGDYKAAANEFAKIGASKTKDATLHAYAVAMKKFCEKQKS